MPEWLRNSVLYEINTWVWLHELSLAANRKVSLGTVPKAAWDRLADLGVAAVWLMGVWERSPAGVALSLANRPLLAELRQTLPDFRSEDVVGSPYCVRRYEVDPHFGGPGELAAARKALSERGIRLVLDFIPNHVAVDHPWVSAHPDWLIQGSAADLRRAPNAFLRVQERVFARGRDPYFPPWSDVLQLNVFNPGERVAALQELQKIATQCDGVRCDMAMLALNQVFARTWRKRAGTIPEQEYWQEVLSSFKPSHPGFGLIAEVYWGLEPKLLSEGFDAAYDKGLRDQLAHGSAESIREHLLRFSASQDRLVRFLENHDEPRAAHVFDGPKALAATVVLLTLPGIRLVHEGQLEGWAIRTPVHVGRRPAEAEAGALTQAYRQLVRLAATKVFHDGRWSPCSTSGWADNSSHRHFLAWSWIDGAERWLIVVNYSPQPAQGRIQLPWQELAGKRWRLVDFLASQPYDREGSELLAPGLFVELGPWAFHLFLFEPVG